MILNNYLAQFSLCRVSYSASNSVNWKSLLDRSEEVSIIISVALLPYHFSLKLFSLAFSERWLLLINAPVWMTVHWYTYSLNNWFTLLKEKRIGLVWFKQIFSARRHSLSGKYERFISYLLISPLTCYLTPHCNCHGCLQMRAVGTISFSYQNVGWFRGLLLLLFPCYWLVHLGLGDEMLPTHRCNFNVEEHFSFL